MLNYMEGVKVKEKITDNNRDVFLNYPDRLIIVNFSTFKIT